VQCCCGRDGGESFGQPERDAHRAGVEAAGVSHPEQHGQRIKSGRFECERGNWSWHVRCANPSRQDRAATVVRTDAGVRTSGR
jgi:hypothetical protein